MPAPSNYTINVSIYDQARNIAVAAPAKTFTVAARTADLAMASARARLVDAGYSVRSASFTPNRGINVILAPGARNAV